jgi:hypothetical protein
MKHNLIIYDITFVEWYNENSIIGKFHGYGLKWHYFKNVYLYYHYYVNIHPMVIVVLKIN